MGTIEENGIVDDVTWISEDYIPTYKLLNKDSLKLNTMLMGRKVSKRKRI